jgi:PAS domain S-box-containing protein
MFSDPAFPTTPNERRVLLLPPTTRDAAAIQKLFAGEKIASCLCTDIAALCEQISDGVGIILVSEESLAAGHRGLMDCVRNQPVWSDLPIIVLSRSGAESPNLNPIIGNLGNVTVLERPVRITTLLSVVRSSLRARERQYQVRGHLAERAHAEAQLRSSEASFRQLADSMPQIVWAARPDGMLDYYNSRWFEYISKDPTQIPEARWDLYIHPDDLPQAYQTWQAALTHGTSYSVEFRVRGASAEYRWFLARALPVKDSAGNIIRWFGTCTDIHDHKLAEADLRRGREQVELVVKGANAGVWYCPLPFDQLIWDDKVKEHFHLPPDANVTIETFYQRLHPEDRERTRAAIDASIAQQRSYEIEYRTVSVDGKAIKWIRASGRGFYDSAGNPTRFDGITIDLTERLRAEKALRESEELHRAVLAALDEGVTLHDEKGTIVLANASAERILGLTLAQLQGRDSFDRRWRSIAEDGSDLTGDQHPPQVALRTRQPVTNFVMGIHRPDGLLVWISVNSIPLLDKLTGQVTRLVTSFFDVTARRQIEKDRERLLDSERAARGESERAGRMKDEFLATLSHELRTPLNAILGWAQIIKANPASADDVTEGMEIIERNARAQTRIIEDLLDMSRIVSGKVRLDVQRIDLESVVSAAVETLRPAAVAKGVSLQAVLDTSAQMVSGDPNRLHQVFWNLLTNAVKFTPRGGRIQVLLERVRSHVEVAVIDSGEGIDSAFLPHVFDRFRQADASTTRRHGGLGLGLAIVKQLVELHGGSVKAASSGRGQGATFTISLPLTAVQPSPGGGGGEHARQHSSALPLLRRPEPRESIAGVRVLVVDDELDARGMLQRLLQDSNAIVTTAASAAEALERLKLERPDVLVSDIGMPGEDGHSLIRRVRLLTPEEGGRTPAMALTAYARGEDRTRAIRAGFQMHVAKPVEPSELIALVASLAGRHE